MRRCAPADDPFLPVQQEFEVAERVERVDLDRPEPLNAHHG
jgi:hypothetical protein